MHDVRSERKTRQAADRQAAAWRIPRHDGVGFRVCCGVVLGLVVQITAERLTNEREEMRNVRLLHRVYLINSFGGVDFELCESV